MPPQPLLLLETTRRQLTASPSCLQVIPAMLQYSLDSSSYAPPLQDCQHEDVACSCGQSPPPACLLLLSALFFLLSVEVVIPNERGGQKKVVRGKSVYVLSMEEVFGMIALHKSKSGFYESLRAKVHHFKCSSLSGEDVDELEMFFKKYSFCFDVLDNSTDDENILKYLLEDEEECAHNNENYNYDSRSHHSVATTSFHTIPKRLDDPQGEGGLSVHADFPPKSSISKAGSRATRPRARTGVSAAGDKKEVFGLFQAISAFLHHAVRYRRAAGFQRPLLLATISHYSFSSLDICEMLLKHHRFCLDRDLENHMFQGSPVLHHAVRRGNTAAVALLLKCGAEVNAHDVEGATPLHALMNKLSPVGRETAKIDCYLPHDSAVSGVGGRGGDSGLLDGSRVIAAWREQDCVPYSEESLLLDLGSDVRQASTSLTNNLQTSTADVALQEVPDYSRRRGGRMEDEDEKDEEDVSCGEKKEPQQRHIIIPPQVAVVTLPTRSERHMQHDQHQDQHQEDIQSHAEEEFPYHSHSGEDEEGAMLLAEVVATATVLLAAGADTTAQDAQGCLPFSRVQHTHPALCTQLQEAAARAMSPLHVALISGLPDDPLLSLITQHAQRVSHRMPQNKLPLHLALEFSRSAAVVTALLLHYPDAARVPFARNRKRQVIYKTANSDKRTITDAIITEEQLPFFYAVEKELSAEVLKVLLAHTLPVNIFGDADAVADIFGYHFEQVEPLVYQHQHAANHGDAWIWVLGYRPSSHATSTEEDESKAEDKAVCGSAGAHGPRLHLPTSTQLSLVSHIAQTFIRLIDGLVYCRSTSSQQHRQGRYAIALATPACRFDVTLLFVYVILSGNTDY